MKQQYFRFTTLILFIFGLVSCSSDKTTELPSSPKQIEAEIQNTDDTIQEIQRTKLLRASSFISLELSPEETEESEVLSQVSCQNSGSEAIYDKETLLKKLSHIPVKDILPGEAFIPHSSSAQQTQCNLKIVILLKESKINITLNQVRIQETESFNNFNISYVDENNNYFLLKDIKDSELPFPMPNGAIKTLCTKSHNFNYYVGSPIKMEQLLSTLNESDQNIQRCRLHMRDELSQNAWISESFDVQTRVGEMQKNININFQGEPQVYYNQTSVGTWEIYNTGKAPFYFQLDLPTPQISMTGIYQHGSENIFRYNNTLALSAQWNVSMRPRSNVGQSNVLKLEPGEAFSINLVAHGQHQCKTGVDGGLNFPTCEFDLVFEGLQYLVTGFPTIKVNYHENIAENHWQSLSLAPFNNIFWVPYQQLPSICPDRTVQVTEPTSFQTMAPSQIATHRCD